MPLRLSSRKERISIINTILFRKYHVLSLLGSGGSSSVYLAEHTKLNHFRAIKCIPKHSVRGASGYPEASLLMSLKHPGIPMIYDIEEDDTYFYIIEEYIQGESLAAFVQNRDNISQETVIQFGIQLCEVIAYLHHQKPNPILYLDLKPEHIILCGDRLKLIDFDIATTVGEGGNPYQCCGTRGFAAPEQYNGQPCNERTDVFGIGAILYYMLAGQGLPSFLQNTLPFPKYCSNSFKKIILKAVSPRMELRYSHVDQLREQLKKVSLSRTGRRPGVHLLEKIIVTGSQKRVGTTHVSIGLVSWLNCRGTQAFYEAKGEDMLPSLVSYKEGAVVENGILKYQDFRAVFSGQPKAQATDVHMAVQDFGEDVAAAAEAEGESLILLVLGTRPWEMEAAIRAYDRLSGEEDLVLLCNYNGKQTARRYAGIFRRKVFCFPLDEDPFVQTREKQRLFEEILKERRGR